MCIHRLKLVLNERIARSNTIAGDLEVGVALSIHFDLVANSLGRVARTTSIVRLVATELQILAVLRIELNVRVAMELVAVGILAKLHALANHHWPGAIGTAARMVEVLVPGQSAGCIGCSNRD